MQPHQQRVVEEKQELGGKIVKLMDFFETSIFLGLDEAEQVRLKRQVVAMDAYYSVLCERIAAF